MKFAIRGQLTDIITCVKFLVDRFRGYGVLTPPKLPFPIDLLRRPYNSVALPRDTVMEPVLCQSSAAVAPMQNATIAYQEIPSIFSTVALILSESFYQNLVLVNNIHPYFSRWLIEYCHTNYCEKFGFPVLILKCGSEKLLGSCC